ncbi:MAG: hypothetical protein HQL97_00345 [Magnetococcales bacterium]|nr:hypothetical protein [Magnetococcales bacterium]
MNRLFVALFFVSLMAMPAAAQTVCAQFGAFTDCSGSNNRSATIVDLGNNQGVIITDQSTEPYTILRAPSAHSVPTVPTIESVPMLEAPSQTGGVDSLMLVPGGDSGMGTMFMMGGQ